MQADWKRSLSPEGGGGGATVGEGLGNHASRLNKNKVCMKFLQKYYLQKKIKKNIKEFFFFTKFVKGNILVLSKKLPQNP